MVLRLIQAETGLKMSFCRPIYILFLFVFFVSRAVCSDFNVEVKTIYKGFDKSCRYFMPDEDMLLKYDVKENLMSAYDVNSGGLVWRSIVNQSPEGTIAKYHDNLYYVDTLGDLHCISRFCGKVHWTVEGRGRHPSSPYLFDNHLFVLWPSGYLCKLSPADGQVVWEVPVDEGMVLEIVEVGKSVVAVTSSYAIACKISDGRTKWVFRPLSQFRGRPSVSGDALICEGRSRIYSIDSRFGSENWRYDGIVESVLVGQTIGLIKESRRFEAIRTRDKSPLMKMQMRSKRSHRMYSSNGAILITDGTRLVTAVEVQSRRVRHKLLRHPVDYPMFAANGCQYFKYGNDIVCISVK